MKQFMMQGKAITGPMRYRTYFSPRDLLVCRELAAGFFQQQLRFLSGALLYHTEMFYAVAFDPDWNPDFSLPGEYAGEARALCNLPQYRQKAQLRLYFSTPAQQQNLKAFWALAQETGLPSADWQRLFCLLTAGYGLAGKTLDDCPFSPEEAKAAYLRQTVDSMAQDEEWLSLSGTGPVVLPAREAPYRLLMETGAEALLSEGAVITPRKLKAVPHPQGGRDIPVTLRLYAGPDDPAPQEVRIFPGDYRYLNVVGEKPVHLHPVSAETPFCRVERAGGKLSVTDAQGSRRVFSCGELDIIGFAPEWEDTGWILLSGLGVDYSAYSHRWTYGPVLPGEEETIVEVEFRGAECLLLDQHGYVHSNLHPVSKTRAAALCQFRREKEDAEWNRNR